MEIKDLKGKKSHFIIIVDRSSGFVSAYKLTGTNTKHIFATLQHYVEVYYGSPLLLTSHGGLQFSAANKAIQEWAKDAGFNHDFTAAYSP